MAKRSTNSSPRRARSPASPRHTSRNSSPPHSRCLSSLGATRIQANVELRSEVVRQRERQRDHGMPHGTLIVVFISQVQMVQQWHGGQDIAQFVAVLRNLIGWARPGLCAQIVDGSLGMGYGVTSSTVLVLAGLRPATASASVHPAQLGTTPSPACTPQIRQR